MKELLIITVLVLGVTAEPQAPYPPSGWRPSGPAFTLPQQQSQTPQQYLPPLDPRNPARPGPEYNPPEEDVSVQGLPVAPQQEAQPLFQVSPISGQQYSGPSFNSDLNNLGSFNQPQFEERQLSPKEKQTMQRQWDEARAKSEGLPLPPRQKTPGQFARTTTEAPTTISSKKEVDLNEGEVLNKPASAKLKEKVSVEVTKQNVQEYPGDLFLSSLAQLRLQPQFVPLNYQPSQKQVVGFDAPTHFSALPSVLAQQNLPQQYQNPALIVPQNEGVYVPQQQYQGSYQPQIQMQLQPNPVVIQSPAQFQPNYNVQPNPDAVSIQQPVNYQPQGSFPQFQTQQVLIPQPNFNQQPQNEYSEPNDQQLSQQPIIVQQFPQQYQPNPQNQYLAPQFQGSIQVSPQTQYLQPEVQYSGPQEPQQLQGADSLQSGLDINQNGNDIDEGQADDEEVPDRATAVATAFGTRTQPRVYSQYGAPAPAPRVQANPGYYTTTESAAEEVTESGPAIAQATAVANGERRKSSRLRSRKIRPVYAVDQSGRLILAEA